MGLGDSSVPDVGRGGEALTSGRRHGYGLRVSEPSLSFANRLSLWLSCLVRVLFDGAFAARVWQVRHGQPAQLVAAEPAAGAAEPAETSSEALEAKEQEPAAAADPSALVLLALLQREGRLIDFLEQDITTFDDAEVGAAARVVHEGCGKALRGHAEVVSVRPEEEDSRVEVREGLERGEVKLTGKVSGEPPYRGVLRHKGWRVLRLQLPAPVGGHDASVVAPAEVEL